MNGKCHPDYYTQFLLYFGKFAYEPLNIIMVRNAIKALFFLMA